MLNYDTDEFLLEQDVLFLRYFGQSFQTNSKHININIAKILQNRNKIGYSVKKLSYISKLSESDIEMFLKIDIDENE